MYNHSEIEKKWQKFWEENKTFKTENPSPDELTKGQAKPKFYTLDMFPYPSGAGLHVGHPEWYTANDIISRYKKAKGFNVLHPMGWDAFWLPAENYAIKTGTHPRITTAQNIATFKSQIKSLGFSYDWDREIDTTDPKYFKWTQWIFAKMFEAGLAYEQDLPINFCPKCMTWVANEEILNNGSHERCGTPVEKKKLRQWVLAITKYADRLEKDIDDVDWPEGIKDMQRKWIGRSEGCEIEMKVFSPLPKGEGIKIPNTSLPLGETEWGQKIGGIRIYTTRIDTVFGMTYAVIAPDHEKVQDFITPEQLASCEAYILSAKNKSDLDRTGTKEKTWVFTGSYVVNPFNNQKVPLWIGDYVLGNYGTGAVMAVPAHDERDFEFAKKYDLEIKQSIASPHPLPLGETEWGLEKAFTEDWILVNSWDFTGLTSAEAREQLANFSEKNGFGAKKINYKLRDWLFSRQRYWGEPIPLIHLEKEDFAKLPRITDMSQEMLPNVAYVYDKSETWTRCKNCTCGDVGCVKLVINGKTFSRVYDGLYTKIVVDYRLPLELPEVEKYEPSPDGNSPLANVESFVNVELASNLSWKRETNTMPQWGWSCWYYLRFMDASNPDELVNKWVESYWGGVDSYVGWAEHAVLHLLYARFWHKFLYDIWVVSTKEPFHKLRNQGLILAYAYQNANGALIPNDEVEEKDGKFFDKNTWEELNQIVAKMSKSLKNVVNPDDIVKEYGADALRLYEMYMSDFKDSAPWDTKNIIWVVRFLEKAEKLFTPDARLSSENNEFTMKLVHKTIKKVSEDIENYKFNTAIASLMILVNNGLPTETEFQREWREVFCKLLHPFAPHLAEELWERMHKETVESIFFAPWPEFDEAMTIDSSVVIWVQILGKLRGTIEIQKDEPQDSVLAKAKQNPDVIKWLEGKEIVKEIYVPGKIVNIVIK